MKPHQNVFGRPLHYATHVNPSLFSTLLEPWNYCATQELTGERSTAYTIQSVTQLEQV